MRARVLCVCSALLVLAALAAGAAEPTQYVPKESAEVTPRRNRRTKLVSRTPVKAASSPAEAAPPAPTLTQAPPTAQAPSQVTPSPVVALVKEAADDAGADSQRPARSAPPSHNPWQQYIQEYARASKDGQNDVSSWLKGVIKLPVGGDSKNQPSSVPVLVLPVPVPVRDTECSANRDRPEKFDFNQDVYKPRGGNEHQRPPPRRPVSYDGDRNPDLDEPSRRYDASRRPFPFDQPQTRPSSFDQPQRPSYDEPRRPASIDKPRRPFDEPHRPLDGAKRPYDEPRRQYDEPRRTGAEPRRPYDEPRRPYDEPRRPYDEPKRPYDEPRRPYDAPRRPSPYDDDGFDEPRPKPAVGRPEPAPAPQPNYYGYQEQNFQVPPPTMTNANSQLLLQLFREQTPMAPHLPAVLVRDRRYDGEEPAPPLAPPPAAPRTRDPPRPRFDRPLMVRGDLTVHRADYTESYTAWWDSASGASRVDMNDGATTTYRMMIGQGQVQRVAMSIDRTGGQDVPRCAVMASGAASPADRAPPALPDMTAFTFDGYKQMGEVRAERWLQTVKGSARGEALTYKHEMLLTRAYNDSAMPLMYSVTVDSSVLGPACDGYVHRYREVREHQPDHAFMHLDIDQSCVSVEQTQELARVEPLREFTLLQRDPRHDQHFTQFTREYERQYADSTEEAVRSNLLMQTSRFVAAGNRLGATFTMAVNFLSDRLDAELATLLGVVFDDEHFPAEQFPHARDKLRALADKLPDEFDWRERGGVSSVRYQGSCSSCWAFAVAGSVEGALFRRTRKLVPLSEQCLVDCAQPYGGRGCGGTWPSHAYDYVQDRGLPALDEYPAYQAKVLSCQDRRVPPVTQISAHVNVTTHSVPALKVAIRRHAPTVVIIDAMLKSFQTYKSGVFYDDRCSKVKKKLKHAVLAVGWGSQKGEPHFILKNSWSAAWGDGGYIRMHGPSNTCGVLTLPSYPRLENDDVLRLPGGGRGAGGDATARSAAEDQDYD